jgi:hypothetical protein
MRAMMPWTGMSNLRRDLERFFGDLKMEEFPALGDWCPTWMYWRPRRHWSSWRRHPDSTQRHPDLTTGAAADDQGREEAGEGGEG